MRLTCIGAVCEEYGVDEYVLLQPEGDEQPDEHDALRFLTEQRYRESRGPGTSYCVALSVTPKPYADHTFIGIACHRRDV
jgi:hypothetical protein